VARELGLACRQQELLVSIMPLGAVSASLAAGSLIDTFGRKLTIQCTALVFLVGSLLLGLAPSLPFLLLGRFVLGFAVSLTAMAETVYISEIAGSRNRGRLVGLTELGITLGFLLAFIVNYILLTVAGGWRGMFALAGLLAAVQGVAMAALPRSPHFLVRCGRPEEAGRVVARLRGCSVARARLQVAAIRAEEQRRVGQGGAAAACVGLLGTEDNMRARLLAGLGLVLAQQLTGQPNLLYYAQDIAAGVGFCGEALSALATVLLGLVKVGATLLSLATVDRLGRRTLLLAGAAAITISLLCLAVTAAASQQSPGGWSPQQTCALPGNTTSCPTGPAPGPGRYLAFLALVTYTAAYSLSFGPLTWLLLAELYPVQHKAQAVALGQAVNWAVNSLVSATFLDSVNTFSLAGVFSCYCGAGCLACLFIYHYVPETRGRSLEQISADLRQPSNTRHKTFSPLPGVRPGQQQPATVSLQLRELNTTNITPPL